ncbi:hypothetical protein GHT06_022219 [Daphnia sinensis]|uniref:Uncharacterized protein n=1 Tax=Daphnia sinensis TaxID=1820382 RepID=A0AAD5L6D0_9CRUS|nr:hypothetical protein GHT06_022219 [Daphnia sinensis]
MKQKRIGEIFKRQRICACVLCIRQSGNESWTIFYCLMKRTAVAKEQPERERKILSQKGFVSSILRRDGNHVNARY